MEPPGSQIHNFMKYIVFLLAIIASVPALSQGATFTYELENGRQLIVPISCELTDIVYSYTPSEFDEPFALEVFDCCNLEGERTTVTVRAGSAQTYRWDVWATNVDPRNETSTFLQQISVELLFQLTTDDRVIVVMPGYEGYKLLPSSKNLPHSMISFTRDAQGNFSGGGIHLIHSTAKYRVGELRTNG